MDIKQIRAFLAVASLNSFTQAAEQLGYAQSSITAQIQLLEKEVGVRLFERLNKKVSLTAEGKNFLAYSRQMIDLWETAKGSLTISDEPRGTLVIGSDESICAVKLPSFLKEFNRRYPKVEVNIKIGSSCDLVNLARENEIDVAILLEQKLTNSDFVIEKHQLEPLALLVSPEHPLASGKTAHFADMAGYPFLLASQSCSWRTLFQDIMKDANVQPNLMLDSGSIQTLKQLAISGLGITLLPLYAVTEELAKNQLVKLNWEGVDLQLSTQVIRHKDKWISLPVQAFLAMCKEVEL
ncbi:MAG TPA: LysR family transcriptional regulator [Negativicutes bacterium]